ncbi:hypothetical protein C7G83_15685 [Siccibacter turicensis]|uniref:Uncharacterized protein n=1 Tax=Siccibacter turicensis TaxID=357233 RepID=A0A2P8VH89_9ENTR|nr:hypothetical protein C7G83_15685 [Siccibacter turicensis]
MKKSLREGGFWRVVFRFFSYAQSPLVSGAKVKKEAENSSVHACSYLVDSVENAIEKFYG